MRGDRPYPVSASDDDRSVWKIYIDDLIEMETFQTERALAKESLIGTRQGTIRVSCEERAIPRSIGKAYTGDLVISHVGCQVEGDTFSMGSQVFGPSRRRRSVSMVFGVLGRHCSFTGVVGARVAASTTPLWSFSRSFGLCSSAQRRRWCSGRFPSQVDSMFWDS